MYFRHIKYNCPQLPKKRFSKYLFKKGNVLHIFTFNFFVLVIWRFNGLWITVFFTVIITMILALVFIVFTSLFLNMFIKLFNITGIFAHFSIISFVSFLRIILGFFIISCLAVSFFLSLHCSSVFVLTFYMFFTCLLILTTIIHQHVLLFSYSCEFNSAK